MLPANEGTKVHPDERAELVPKTGVLSTGDGVTAWVVGVTTPVLGVKALFDPDMLVLVGVTVVEDRLEDPESWLVEGDTMVRDVLDDPSMVPDDGMTLNLDSELSPSIEVVVGGTTTDEGSTGP